MTVSLITGANKGIGFEIARGLTGTVLIGARDARRGEAAAARLRDEGADAVHVGIDVTDPDSIAAAARTIGSAYGSLDALVNNAALSALEWNTPPSEGDIGVLRETFEVNVIGLAAVTKAMLPLLRKAKAARIVNVSSRLGSMTAMRDWEAPIAMMNLLAYNASKAAVNSLTVSYANELRHTTIKVNSVNPGFCDTDMAADMVAQIGHRPPGLHSPADGARAAIMAAQLPDDGPTGIFFGSDGPDHPLPW